MGNGMATMGAGIMNSMELTPGSVCNLICPKVPSSYVPGRGYMQKSSRKKIRTAVSRPPSPEPRKTLRKFCEIKISKF